MNSLVLRLVSLCAIVALLASAICAFVGVRAVLRVSENRNQTGAIRACGEVEREIAEVLDALSFEIGDYAQWDELYAQAPRPDPAWAKINLIPGATRGRTCQEMVLLEAGKVLGRYDYRGQRDGDPVTNQQIANVCGGAGGLRGLAWFDGNPALWTSRPVVRSDGSGPPRGQLVGIAYFNQDLRTRLTPFDWRFRLLAPGSPATPSDAATIRGSSEVIACDARPIITVEHDREEDLELRAGLVHDIAITGLVVPLVAIVAGVLLGWVWLRPLRLLSAACRRRASDPEAPIPDGGDLDETRVLATALRELVESERSARQRLAADLAGAQASNAVRRRAVARLTLDSTAPIAAIHQLASELAERGGLLPPDGVRQLGEAAEALAGHLYEVSDLAGDNPREDDLVGPVDLATYAGSIADLLRPDLERRRIAFACEVSGRADLDASLLTPILVNLLTNAAHATGDGGRLALRGGVAADQVWWEVEDTGHGLPDELALRLNSACERGEVLPGDPGLGLGLALAITNAGRAGGHVRLVRTSPAGSLFRVELPAVGGAGRPERPVTNAGSPSPIV